MPLKYRLLSAGVLALFALVRSPFLVHCLYVSVEVTLVGAVVITVGACKRLLLLMHAGYVVLHRDPLSEPLFKKEPEQDEKHIPTNTIIPGFTFVHTFFSIGKCLPFLKLIPTLRKMP